MAGAFSTFLKNALINHVLRNTPLTSPSTVYLALFTSDPTPDGIGVEVSGGGYARQPITFAAPSGGVTSNAAQVSFPEATGNWGTVSHWGIFDAPTGGNLLFHGVFTTPKSYTIGDQAIVKLGELSITLS
jgi:hypothetical protein